MNGSDDEHTESSIYDMDSAPPPPVDNRTHLHGSNSDSPTKRRWNTVAALQNAVPARRRANSSLTRPARAQSPVAMTLPSAQSFPPPHNLGKSPNGKQVAFANSRDSDEAMLHIPEIEESEDYLDDEDDIIDEVDKANAQKRNRFDSQELSSSRMSGSGNMETEDETTSNSSRKYVSIFGYPVPAFWCIQSISWNRVAIAVVNRAPCFACTRLQHNTYRSILVRLNILCAFFAAGQLASTLWFYVVMQSPNVVRSISNTTDFESRRRQNEFEVLTNVWNINGAVWFLGLLALVVLVSIGLTIRVISNVNLAGAVRFLWVILWVLPLQVAMVIGLFDYFSVTDVWVKFWWRDKTMDWFRSRFCEPREVANTLCAVPRFQSVEEERNWCVDNYNATGCSDIRNEAQDKTWLFLTSYYYANSAWAICFALLVSFGMLRRDHNSHPQQLFLVVKTLESIISRPLVQKAKESNVPAWLFLPIAGCAIYGALYAFSSTSGLSTRSRSEGRSEAAWIGPLFMAAGGLFFVEAMLAWFLGSFSILNTTDKRRKSVAIMIFIGIAISLIMMLATIFIASITFSLSLEDIRISDVLRGDIACFIDQSGTCTHCEAEFDRCLEWSNEDVTRILQTQAKTGAAFAAIFVVYAVGVLRYGFTLRKYINNYQIAYV